MPDPLTDGVRIRSVTPADLPRCTQICFDAFHDVNARHGFPPDIPTADVAAGLMGFCAGNPQVYGVVAERVDGGVVVGSNFLWEGGGPVFGIGPITVDPAAQARAVGRRLMDAVLARAAERGAAGVRLVQAAFNSQSMSLYAKLGFDVREPLVCINGQPIGQADAVDGYPVRAATAADLDPACDVCRRVHGHDRRGELAHAIDQGTATVVERAGAVVGYATEVGFFAHAVALDNPGLMALVAAAPQFSGPGFLLPSRNGEVFRWCLARGLRVTQPLTLMSRGLYNEPRGAFLPSILF